MKTQLLYLEAPNVLEFEANIIEKTNIANGLYGVYLESTYFYPTSGGQECDHGEIGGSKVVDVYKDPQDESKVLHVLEEEVQLGRAAAHIDPQRRQRHKQHHTAQHILSQCFLKELGMDTVSVKINGYTSSTLDLEAPAIEEADLERIEMITNNIVFQNQPVKSYYVTQEEAYRLALRRQPNVEENIRIVEIEGYDMTPCGGTHCSFTGELGIIKLLRTEHVNSGRTRLHFAAGWLVLDLMRQNMGIMHELHNHFNTASGDIVAAVKRQAKQLTDTCVALQAVQDKLIPLEAGSLAENGKTIAGRKVIFAQFDNRPAKEVQALGEALIQIHQVVVVLFNTNGQKFSLIVCCADDSGINARELLLQLLALLGGRGGGDQKLAQGGGSMDEGQLRTSLKNIQSALEVVIAKKS